MEPDKWAKNRAYRERCRANGLCDHCGKPCAPFKTCKARRHYKNVTYILKQMIKSGELVEVGGQIGLPEQFNLRPAPPVKMKRGRYNLPFRLKAEPDGRTFRKP